MLFLCLVADLVSLSITFPDSPELPSVHSEQSPPPSWRIPSVMIRLQFVDSDSGASFLPRISSADPPLHASLLRSSVTIRGSFISIVCDTHSIGTTPVLLLPEENCTQLSTAAIPVDDLARNISTASLPSSFNFSASHSFANLAAASMGEPSPAVILVVSPTSWPWIWQIGIGMLLLLLCCALAAFVYRELSAALLHSGSKSFLEVPNHPDSSTNTSCSGNQWQFSPCPPPSLLDGASLVSARKKHKKKGHNSPASTPSTPAPVRVQVGPLTPTP